ncbi:MAG: hypothetical protein ACK5JR_05450 [Tropicimonas sp.]|uniref:hypothetical protein n=1 Tax=Tropicimonas sp. TaxID=2067044 RepID=UPI003A89F9F2
MKFDRVLSGASPSAGAPMRRAVRVCRRDDWMETDRGARPVALLRPGDRVYSHETGAEVSVLWMAMSRDGPAGRISFRVMLGNAEERDNGPGALPVGGRISKRTGRLEPVGMDERRH